MTPRLPAQHQDIAVPIWSVHTL